MKLTLSNGQEIKIGVKHDTTPLSLHSDGVQCNFNARCTKVYIKDAVGNPLLEEMSICSPLGDNFCKADGRKFAAEKAISKIKDWTTKEDRKKIFLSICSQFDSNKTKDQRKLECLISEVNKLLKKRQLKAELKEQVIAEEGTGKKILFHQINLPNATV